MAREYKGYTIERLTKLDWIIKDNNGEWVMTDDGRPSTRTLKDAKKLIDRRETQ